MPLGKLYNIYERQLSARAWVHATLNSEHGADQKLETFQHSVYKELKKLQPEKPESGRYCNRTPSNIYCNLRDNVFPNIQKFMKTLMMVRNMNPTGITDEVDIHCLAIAIFKKKTSGLDYAFIQKGEECFDPKHTWDNYLAYLEVREMPKFSETPEFSAEPMNGNKQGNPLLVSNNNNRNNSSGTEDIEETAEESSDSNKENLHKFSTLPAKVPGTYNNVGYMGKKTLKTMDIHAQEKKKREAMMAGIEKSIRKIKKNNGKLVRLLSNARRQNAIREKISLYKIQYNTFKKIDLAHALSYKMKMNELAKFALETYYKMDLEEEAHHIADKSEDELTEKEDDTDEDSDSVLAFGGINKSLVFDNNKKKKDNDDMSETSSDDVQVISHEKKYDDDDDSHTEYDSDKMIGL